MPDEIADTFRRYWLIIVGAVGLCLSAGQILVTMQNDIIKLRGDMEQYQTTRTLLLDKIDDHFARIDRRLDVLEKGRQ